MESALNWHEARALLEWQIELGATEAISDAPIDRYEVPPEAPKPKVVPIAPQAAAVAAPAPEINLVAEAQAAAKSAQSLEALEAALAAFPHCALKNGARNLVFSDGDARARVMILGDAPEREEDIAGKPFVGRTGALLDKMLAAIDLGRDGPDAERAVYLSTVLPWRPPQNRDPSAEDIAMLRPFVERHIELVDPDVVVLMGNLPCLMMLGQNRALRLRGKWSEAMERPCLPMLHPAYLLRNPLAKRDAWHDLLMLKAKLGDT